MPNEILNTDQVGIEKELHSTRTLSFQGEKKTLGSVASKNATMHSYTIQPTINLDGQLVGPMYLYLQEPNGNMGNIVKRRLFQVKNVIITCSSSGKLTNSLVKYWRDKVVKNLSANDVLPVRKIGSVSRTFLPIGSVSRTFLPIGRVSEDILLIGRMSLTLCQLAERHWQKRELAEWHRSGKVLVPSIGRKTLLLSDSWSG